MAQYYPVEWIFTPANDAQAVMYYHFQRGGGFNWPLINRDYGEREILLTLADAPMGLDDYYEELERKFERWQARGSRTVRRPSIPATVETLREFAKEYRYGSPKGAKVDYPALLIAESGCCALATEGGRYVMTGSGYGRHSLDIGQTDLKRLEHHWEGYQEIAS